MSATSAKYVLDANAFIQAKRRYYGFAFCPGYWQALKWHQQQGRLCSVDRVHEELTRGRDDLSDWVEQQFGEEAFADTSTPDVTATYAQMLAWVMAQPQFMDSAKVEFQQVADGWLAAYAKVNESVVVTLEEFDSVIRKKVPLPNVCRAFDVETITPFEMLRRLNVVLAWSPPA